MPTVGSTQARVEKVLVEAVSLLVERARTELERDAASPDRSPHTELQRVRELEDELSAIRQELARSVATASTGPQLSRYYEVPGQEDA